MRKVMESEYEKKMKIELHESRKMIYIVVKHK